MHIGVIGIGVVGKAVVEGLWKLGQAVSSFDRYKPGFITNWEKINESDFCFVCVPTPTDPEKGCSLEAIRDALAHLNSLNYAKPVVIKSTVIPGTTRQLAGELPDLKLVHNPEFMTERNAENDFLKQTTAIMSGSIPDTAIVQKFYDEILDVPIIRVSPFFEVTEWAKYIHNCVLPVKLSFLNEMRLLIKDPVYFKEAMSFAGPFGNLGANSSVPGPDGKFGWAGGCFPKDTLALSLFARQVGVEMPTLDGAIETNRKLRPGALQGGKNA